MNSEALINSQRERIVLFWKKKEVDKREASPMATEETRTPALAATNGRKAEHGTEIRSKLLSI